MEQSCVHEVLEQHRLMENWLAGTVPQTRENFADIGGVLSNGFVAITTDGKLRPRDDFLDDLWNAHGTMGERFSIEIHNAAVRVSEPPLYLLTYEEWRYDGRLTTALMRVEEGPRPLWLHLQETWLPV